MNAAHDEQHHAPVADLGFQSWGTDENDIVNEHGHDIIRSLNDDKIVVISYMFSTFHNSNILIQVSS